jgi:hypothetical protein
MTKINFKKIIIRDIEGREQEADFSKQLGNQLYMQGHDIEECELGKRIYFAGGEVELTAEECSIVKKAIAPYSFVARDAIMRQLGKEAEP